MLYVRSEHGLILMDMNMQCCVTGKNMQLCHPLRKLWMHLLLMYLLVLPVLFYINFAAITAHWKLRIIFRYELQFLMLTLLIWCSDCPLYFMFRTSQQASSMTGKTLILYAKAACILCFRPRVSQGGTLIGFITSFHLKNWDNLLPIHINNLIRQRDFFNGG